MPLILAGLSKECLLESADRLLDPLQRIVNERRM